MEFWRVIWNGPFYIGKLERPVSVGDAIMKVLETAWRGAVIIVAAFAALFSYIAYDSWSKSRAEAAALTTTEIVASYNPAVCGDSQPIEVVIGNSGRRTLSYVSYIIEVLDRPGGRNIAPV